MSSKLFSHLPKLFLPLVRFCLRRGLKVQELQKALKRAVLDAVVEDFELQDTKPSVSRLSVATGLQRAEINRLMSQEPTAEESRSLFSRILGQWRNGRNFTEQDGTPKVLQFANKQDQFGLLVASVSKELNPYAVLFELERMKLVERTPEGIRLLSSIYHANDDLLEALRMMSVSIRNLVGAIEYNVIAKPALPNLQLRVDFDNLCLEELPQIKRWLLLQGTDFTQKVQAYLSQFDKDLNPTLASKRGGGRVAFESLSYAEEHEDAPPGK